MTLTRYVLLLQAVFVLTRAYLYSRGVSFDATPLYYFVQYIDPQLLQTRLLESLYYLHSQPPLFNLFLGVLLKCFPSDFIFAANSLYLILGQLFMAGVFMLMVRLGARPLLAFLAATVFMVSPSVIMYENLLFYEYPAAVLMVWAGLWLHLYAQKRQAFHGFMFFLTLVLLGSLKSIFHLFWVLLAIVFVWQALKIPTRKILLLAGIPFALLASVYMKNLLVFGDFTLGYVVISENILNMAANVLPKKKIYEYYKEGKISPLTAVTILNEGQYMDREERQAIVASVLSKIKWTGIPLLDWQFNPTSRKPSLHSLLAYSNYRQYSKDSLFMIKSDFRSFQLSIERSLILYFFPGPTEMTVHNREYLSAYEDNYNFLFKHLNGLNNGQLYTKYLLRWNDIYDLKWDNVAAFCLSVTVALYVFVFLCGIQKVAALIRRSRRFDEDSVTLTFILFNIFYISSMSILLSWWGTNRYRFNIESFYWVLFAVLLTQTCQYLQSRLQRRI